MKDRQRVAHSDYDIIDGQQQHDDHLEAADFYLFGVHFLW